MAKRLCKKERKPLIAALRIRDGARCNDCGCPEEFRTITIYRGELVMSNLEMDHVEPFALSQSNALSNLQLLCGDCHALKTSIDIHHIRAVRGF